MARALMGHVGNSTDQLLAFEVRRLRRRISELEAEVAQLRQDRSDAPLDIELELHRITETAALA